MNYRYGDKRVKGDQTRLYDLVTVADEIAGLLLQVVASLDAENTNMMTDPFSSTVGCQKKFAQANRGFPLCLNVMKRKWLQQKTEYQYQE